MGGEGGVTDALLLRDPKTEQTDLRQTKYSVGNFISKLQINISCMSSLQASLGLCRCYTEH